MAPDEISACLRFQRVLPNSEASVVSVFSPSGESKVCVGADIGLFMILFLWRTLHTLAFCSLFCC